MRKLNLLLIFMLLLFSSFVFAEDIRFIGKQYENFSIIDFCYIDGANCPNTIPCNITITSDLGALISNAAMENKGDYLNYNLSDIYTSIAKIYQASVVCIYNSTLSANDNFFFSINRYGDKTNNGNTNIAIVIGLGILAIILLLMYYFIDKEHWLFKIIIIMLVPLVIINIGSVLSTMTIGTYFEQIGLGLYKIGLWFIRIFYTYVIIALIYSAFSTFKQAMKKHHK